MLTWAYSDAMNRARVIGVDFIKLRAMMHEGEGTQGSSGGEL
jgi:hypothetical protein